MLTKSPHCITFQRCKKSRGLGRAALAEVPHFVQPLGKPRHNPIQSEEACSYKFYGILGDSLMTVKLGYVDNRNPQFES